MSGVALLPSAMQHQRVYTCSSVWLARLPRAATEWQVMSTELHRLKLSGDGTQHPHPAHEFIILTRLVFARLQ